MIRTARVVPILAALLLLYFMNATAAWVALLTIFGGVMIRRRRSCEGPGKSLTTASEEG